MKLRRRALKIHLAVASVVVISLSGCATNAITSGRVVIQDDHARVAVSIGERDRAIIARYYERLRHKHKTPPGLAKRNGGLPPGLVKRDRLPPGLEARGLPLELERELSPVPQGYVRVVIGRDIVLMESRKRVIIDIYRDIAF
jgi:hypothetical protein